MIFSCPRPWAAGIVAISLLAAFLVVRKFNPQEAVSYPADLDQPPFENPDQNSKVVTFAESSEGRSIFQGSESPPKVPDPAWLLDPNVSLRKRNAWARQLGKYGGLEDWRKAFQSEIPDGMRVALVEGVGESGQKQAGAFLRESLNYPVQDVRRGILRGLGETGVDEDATFLSEFLARPDWSIEETTEAALALGASGAGSATALLIRSYEKFPEGELGDHLLLALAQKPLDQAGDFVAGFLADPQHEPAQKRELLSGLGHAGQVNPEFFSRYLEASEVEVRRGAYQGLGALGSPEAGAKLFDHLQRETDPPSRVAIYEGLQFSQWQDPMQLHYFAFSEKDPDVRIQAAKAVAAGLRNRPATDPVVDVFNRTWVPELVQRGLTGDRTEAFNALAALAMTPSSSGKSGLVQISRQAPDPKVREKARKLLESLR